MTYSCHLRNVSVCILSCISLVLCLCMSVYRLVYLCVVKAMKVLLYDAVEQAPSADSWLCWICLLVPVSCSHPVSQPSLLIFMMSAFSDSFVS